MNAIRKYIEEKVSAVVRTNSPEQSLEIAKALVKGGIKIIEITIENPLMIDVIKQLKASFPQLTIAAGGVITSRQAQQAILSGADVIVSPIFQSNLVKLCQAHDIPIITTATTPNEAYQAWKARMPLIKIFPTQQMGGALYIQDLLRPMSFLSIIATGNVKADDFMDYLNAGASAVAIGRDFWLDMNYDEITTRAQFVVGQLKTLKK